MKYRHEWKHEINYADMLVLRARLPAIMKPDSHAGDGCYKIRSIYFDTPTDKALREKLDGVNGREKFRIRYYNGDTSFIRLEKKSKLNGLCCKESCPISKNEAQMLLSGELSWMMKSGRVLCRELYCKMCSEGLKPKTVVDYTREAFTYPAGNVRVTLDSGIRMGTLHGNYLDPDAVTVPAGNAPIILEVKWDEFLPDIIKDAVTINGRRMTAFSKYAQCRIYG